MFSTGQFHKHVPRDRRENVRFRRDLVARAKGDKAFQQDLLRMCQQDIIFFINGFVWQTNPRKLREAGVAPFVTWGFQDEALRAILDSIECHCRYDEDGILRHDGEAHQHDLLIEKSREMGASWLCLIVMVWFLLFHPWKKFLCISRNLEAVDSEDPDSLFWKIDFILRYLPGWMLPPIKRLRKTPYFGNLANGSTITGQASTGKAGVGGRATCMFIDEFSQITEDREVESRTSDTTGCRIFNGTHKGKGTAFYAMSVRAGVRKLRMHWSQHPDKNKGIYKVDPVTRQVEKLDRDYPYLKYKFITDAGPTGGPFPFLRSPWYDEQCRRKPNSREVAMDLDIDPEGSVSQVFDALTIRMLTEDYVRPPVWEGDISYDRDSGRPIALVKVKNGPVKLWLNLKPDGTPPFGKYAAGADISSGAGVTNSVFTILNARTGEKVLEMATPNVLPERLAAICTALCWLFQGEDGEPTYFGWEHHGPGIVFGKKVLELGYRRLYWREGQTVGLMQGKTSLVPGWYPSVDNKTLLLHEYRDALYSRHVINHCKEALAETLSYVYNASGAPEHPDEVKSDDPSGARMNHGDRVIADALAWMGAKKLGCVKAKQEPETQVKVGSLAWRRELAGMAGDDRERPLEGW